MGNLAKENNIGFKCPYKNCDKSKNRFFSLGGIFQHLRAIHPGYLERKLKLTTHHRDEYDS